MRILTIRARYNFHRSEAGQAGNKLLFQAIGACDLDL
jgi:hypothetical protein